MESIDLSGLKDIHLPQEPSFFPPSWTGLTLIAALVCLIFASRAAYRFFKRMTARKYALKELNALEKSKKSACARVSGALILLKRLAMLKFKDEKIATMHGDDWTRFLAGDAKTPLFQGALGDMIKNIQYAPPRSLNPNDVRAFFLDARTWINRNI